MDTKKFYGLWIARDKDYQEIIKSGIWQNNFSNTDRIPKQLENINIGDNVFLFQIVADEPIKNTPYKEFIEDKLNFLDPNQITTKATAWAIGKVKNKDLQNAKLIIDWEKDYKPISWHTYTRQDGIWELDLDIKDKKKQEKYLELYKMIFENKPQNYKWWVEQGTFDRYKNTYWLIPNNPSTYDAINAFKNLETIDWGNSANNKFKIGDIVYIYASKPIQGIIVKTEVIKTDITNENLIDDDKKYLKDDIRNRDSYIRLKIISFTNPNILSLENLQKNGLNGNIQGKRKIKGKLLEYILKNDNQKGLSMSNKATQPLNQILYGPPGTGKTYNTINKALEIIAQKDETLQKFLEENKERKKLKEKFNEYRENGQIEFITFHQSYGYEEFVEGIKPCSLDGCDNENSDIQYHVADGVFKVLSNKANKNYNNSKKDTNELSKEQEFEQKLEILKDKIEQEIEQNGFYSLDRTKIFIESILEKSFRYRSENWQRASSMSFNDLRILYLLGIKERKEIKKIKNITSNAKNHATYVIKVLQQLYNITIDNIVAQKEQTINYILIIDEINRGNISKIFGELITLIEPSKRIGEDEEIKVKLPYSKDEFGVPKNLYIIGTMNTADRSIAHIDTALRRRFEFVEMMPKPEILKDLIIEGIEIEKIISAINERIEYIYDREHTIGHSYFMPLTKNPIKEKLDEIFRVNIIPLLAEYFYDDWEDIRFVLNNDFIKEKQSSIYIKKDSSKELNKVYEISDKFETNDYIKIYK